MSTQKELQEALEDAVADAEAAIEHRQKVKADLIEAEARVTKALKRETEARFALRAAAVCD